MTHIIILNGFFMTTCKKFFKKLLAGCHKKTIKNYNMGHGEFGLMLQRSPAAFCNQTYIDSNSKELITGTKMYEYNQILHLRHHRKECSERNFIHLENIFRH